MEEGYPGGDLGDELMQPSEGGRAVPSLQPLDGDCRGWGAARHGGNMDAHPHA